MIPRVSVHSEEAIPTNANTTVIIDDKRYFHSNYTKVASERKHYLNV